MAEVTITVRGEFEAAHPPERATVRLGVGAEGATKDAVFASAVQTARVLNGQIESLMDAEHGPVTWWASDQVRTWSHRPWNQDGRQLPQVHHAGVDFTVRFSDFEVLSKWLSGVSAMQGVSVSGIEWTLTEPRKVQLTDQVRAAAVHDARDKAQSYASSLGLGTVRVVAIADVGMLGTAPPTSPMPRAAHMMSAAPESAEELSLTPQDVLLLAAVDARFVAT